MGDEQNNKPSFMDSFKSIGNAIKNEINKHGGLKGVASETFDMSKKAMADTAHTLSEAVNDINDKIEEQKEEAKAKNAKPISYTAKETDAMKQEMKEKNKEFMKIINDK